MHPFTQVGCIVSICGTQAMWYPVSLTWPSSCSPSDEARDFTNFVRENIPEGYFANSTEAQLRS